MDRQEAIKVIRSNWPEGRHQLKEALKTLIPELQESEDERIRRELISLFQDCVNNRSHPYDASDSRRWVAWLEKQGEQSIHEGTFVNVDDVREEFMQEVYRVLDADSTNDRANQIIGVFDSLPTIVIEKQGEQNPVDKVEPKFKVGDWIINSEGMLRHILAVDKTGYQTDYGWLTHDIYDNTYHLWTIQDAKDGDVLANNGNIILFKEISNSARKDYKHIKSHCLVLIHSLDFYTGGSYNLDDGFHPATKEQRDLLFSKMKKAGYEWDAEKKELKKIENEIEIPFGAKDSELQEVTYYIPKGFHAEIDDGKVVIKQGELEPAWSEEDEPQKELAETYLAVFDEKFPILPTLKGKQLADYKNFLNKCQQILGLKYWSLRPLQAKLFEKLSLLWAAWGAEHLKGLGQTNGDTDNEKQEWSEEDEYHKRQILRNLKNSGCSQTLQERTEKWIEERLKSLRPQNTWKPSDVQMEVLLGEANAWTKGCPKQKILESLYNDLKKLKG